MCVLVTGAAGFIGRRLVEVLCDANIRVKALSRCDRTEDVAKKCPNGRITSVTADLTRADSVRRVCDGVNSVFHLAGYAHATHVRDVSSSIVHRQVTVDGTRALLEEARRAGVKRFVFVSSVKAMGESADGINETAVAAPTTEYGRAKLEAERLVIAMSRDSGMHVSVLRLPVVYGPGVKGNLRHMIGAIDRGRFPRLPNVSNRRSMVHVDDVVQALRLVLDNPKANGEVYLVTDGRIYSTYEIFVLIRRALGRADPAWTVPLPVLQAVAGVGDVISRIQARPFHFNSAMLDKLFGSAWYKSEKIERDLGFKATQTLEAALPAIIDQYRESSRWHN